MRILVIGGHGRGVGKTSLAVDLIRAFPQAAWTAAKITAHGHSVCRVHGEPCICTPGDPEVALDEEHDRSDRTDTSRFLVAGATRSFWLRAPEGGLARGLPLLREALGNAENVILESNAVLEFLKPDLYLVVLDATQPDFKASALRYLDRADAFVLRSAMAHAPWPDVSTSLFEGRPAFCQALKQPLPSEIRDFVFLRFWKSMHPMLPT